MGSEEEKLAELVNRLKRMTEKQAEIERRLKEVEGSLKTEEKEE